MTVMHTGMHHDHLNLINCANRQMNHGEVV